MQQAGPADDDDEEIWVKEEDDEEEEDGYYMDPRSPAVWTPGGRAGGTSNRRRAREEKDRTKMRERQRRAITGRILAGLRQHGNYRLRARADINEVIAALAREAGWVVLPDGTTFPSSSSFAAVAAQVALSLCLPAPSFPSELVTSISIGKKGNGLSELAALRCEMGREGERRKRVSSQLSVCIYCTVLMMS
uniref:Protein BZR1 homolog n=1 Tax=Zea mays TaxID=4577 RepID=B6U7M6_MAIZE|nr:hypothetical protein [Zea mays]